MAAMFRRTASWRINAPDTLEALPRRGCRAQPGVAYSRTPGDRPPGSYFGVDPNRVSDQLPVASLHTAVYFFFRVSWVNWTIQLHPACKCGMSGKVNAIDRVDGQKVSH